MTSFCRHFVLSLLAGLMLCAGCGKAPSPAFRPNEVEWLKQERTNLGADERFEVELRDEVRQIMTELFGTPDHARFPFSQFLEDKSSAAGRSIVALDSLRLAAGPVASDIEGKPQGLYREHCAACHGIDGDGAGPNASILAPYPRDFRMGKFKFKSTPPRFPPTDDDLKTLLHRGIPGTAMPSFSRLDPEEIDSLVDYVKYLSIRGQFERYLLFEVSSLDQPTFFDSKDLRNQLLPEPNLNSVEHTVVEPSTSDLAKQADTEFDIKQSTAALGSVKLLAALQEAYPDVLEEQFDDYVLQRWAATSGNSKAFIASDQANRQASSPPDWIDPGDPQNASQVLAGKALFLGKGTCHQCHGRDGRGDGQLAGYDDWTDDWIKSPGIDVNDRQTYNEFIKAGAHRPVLANPRNLHQAIYRGGGDPATLYLRVANGIEGSPMPPASALTPDEIWSLVAFLKALPNQPNLLDPPPRP